MSVKEDLPIRPGLVVPAEELSWTASRSGGPGGQNVNKVASKVTVRWDLARSRVFAAEEERARVLGRIPPRFLTRAGEVVISSERTRDQAVNLADCLEKLAEVLREAVKRPKKRRPTAPGAGVRRRRRAAKEAHSQKKEGRRRPAGD